MSRLKEQEQYTEDIAKDLVWYRWGSVICVILCVAGFISTNSFFTDLRYGAGVIAVLFISTYIDTSRRLRRLWEANGRNEYILEKEFKTAIYDKDGNEIEEDDEVKK